MGLTGSKWTSLILISSILIVFTGFNYYKQSILNFEEKTSNGEWIISTPEMENMDPLMLDKMMKVISKEKLPIDSLIIIRNGQIVKEEYPSSLISQDKKCKLYSATKSITSALIGIAIQEGYIESVDQKLMDFFPNRVIMDLDQRKEITIKHLLTMTAGYQWGNDGTGTGMRTSADPVQYVLDKPMVQTPGSVYNYGDGAPFLLGAILSEATGMSVLEFATEYLFVPLNITDVFWESNGEQYFAASGLHLRPRDMAKIGQLFLNDGKWGNEQIISQDWVRASTQIRVSGSGFIAGEQFFVEGYGYLWWIYPDSGVYYASGMYEQRIYVCPGLELVVVFTLHNNDAEVTPRLLFQYVLPACEEYSPTSYSKYGVSFSYPRGMKVVEAPSPFGGEVVSEKSGFIQAYFAYPYQSISVMWYHTNSELKLGSEMDRLFSMIKSETTIIERGSTKSIEVNGRTILCSSANVTENNHKTSGMICCWFFNNTEKVIITYYVADPNFFSQKEIENSFFNHIDSFQDR